MRREEKTVPIGPGRSLHAVSAGSGPELVLIHGALATAQDWLCGPFDALARDFEVTAVDRPGHGRSLRPRFEGTPRDQATQIRAGLIELGVERPILVAHSFGGLVALAYAECFPDALAGLVLIAPIAFPEPRPIEHGLLAPRAAPVIGPWLSLLGEATIDRVLVEQAQKLMFSPQPVPPEWKAGYPWDEVLTPRAMVAEGEDAASVLPLSPAASIDFGRVRAPTQILAGTADRIVNPLLHARGLAGQLPEARLEELAGIGHMLHHAAPEAVIAAIREAVAMA